MRRAQQHSPVRKAVEFLWKARSALAVLEVSRGHDPAYPIVVEEMKDLLEQIEALLVPSLTKECLDEESVMALAQRLFEKLVDRGLKLVGKNGDNSKLSCLFDSCRLWQEQFINGFCRTFHQGFAH